MNTACDQLGEGIQIRDVDGTILALMGLHDEQLTYRHPGRIRKLTDIGGKVLRQIIS